MFFNSFVTNCGIIVYVSHLLLIMTMVFSAKAGVNTTFRRGLLKQQYREKAGLNITFLGILLNHLSRSYVVKFKKIMK